MREDETSPVLNTKVSRKEYDRFLAIATRLRKTPYALLQELVYRFNELFLAEDSGLQELYLTKQRLEAELDRRFESLLIYQAKARSATAQNEDRESGALKRFVATFSERGISKAIDEMRELPEDVRVRMQTRLARDLPDLWRQARAYVSGKPQVVTGKPEAYSKPGGNPTHEEEGEDAG